MLLYILLIDFVCSVLITHRKLQRCSSLHKRMAANTYLYSPLSISIHCEEFNKMYILYLFHIAVKSNGKAKIIYVPWETGYPWSSAIYILILMP